MLLKANILESRNLSEEKCEISTTIWGGGGPISKSFVPIFRSFVCIFERFVPILSLLLLIYT